MHYMVHIINLVLNTCKQYPPLTRSFMDKIHELLLYTCDKSTLSPKYGVAFVHLQSHIFFTVRKALETNCHLPSRLRMYFLTGVAVYPPFYTLRRQLYQWSPLYCGGCSCRNNGGVHSLQHPHFVDSYHNNY